MWRSLATKRVKEVRFLLNQAAPGSEAAKTFLQKNYTAMKKDNPALPILIRESKMVQTPAVVARFGTFLPSTFLTFVPVYFRDCLALAHCVSRVSHARIDFGSETVIPLTGVSEADLATKLQNLVNPALKN